MTETPAETIRRAVDLMRKRAAEATPGPWSRPLNTRNKAVVTAPLPEGERGTYVGGVDRTTGERERCCVVQANTLSNGQHFRKRSGRDLEYIAALHPTVALLLADTWDAIADDMGDEEVTERGAAGVGVLVLGRLFSPRKPWTTALAAARAYLGEASDG